MRYKFAIIVLLLFLLISPRILRGQENQDQTTALQKQIADYQQKLIEIRQEKNTLSSQIQYMDTQIYLTGLRIQDTEATIKKMQKEIDLLTSRIEGLDSSLDHLSQTLLERLIEGYKARTMTVFDIVLDSQNANEFINQVKYYKTARDNNQKLLVQVQETKLNFEDQKKIREDKKVQLDKLTTTLTSQKHDLDVQKVQKQKLLADTQNDEQTYQSLLQQAQTQLSAFKTFVKSSGAGSVIGANEFGNGSDGAYFSQRDVRWASQTIGNSSDNILNVGCLLTSIVMVLKKNGVDINPSAIASNSNYFSLNTAFMKFRTSFNPWPGGLNNSQISIADVDNELNQGHYVIAGINYGPCRGNSDHFVVLTKKDGNDYIMHDPLYGPDIKFSSHYSQVCWAETFK
ncbi:MAG: hypothetical protein Q7S61_00805 [bacterium]|nr:hypothetical protein [bacterium]